LQAVSHSSRRDLWEKEKECCSVAELALHFASSLKQRERKQADMKECAGEFPPEASYGSVCLTKFWLKLAKKTPF